MLYTGVNHFNWQVNNWGDTYPGNAVTYTLLTADATPHVKGADAAALVGIAEDCYYVSIVVSGAATLGTIRRQMVDVLIDPAAGVGNAGSSWSVLINNLLCNSPTYGLGGHGFMFHFPLFIPAGTAIGARTQDTVADATCRFFIQLYGRPTRPDLLNVGSIVETIGATTASTSGVALTVGNATVGTYSASLGTLTRPAWWWQLGWGTDDTTLNAQTIHFDIAHDATAKYICAPNIRGGCTSATNDTCVKEAIGSRLPILHAPAGTDVYVRGTATSTPDGNNTVVVYALS